MALNCNPSILENPGVDLVANLPRKLGQNAGIHVVGVLSIFPLVENLVRMAGLVSRDGSLVWCPVAR